MGLDPFEVMPVPEQPETARLSWLYQLIGAPRREVGGQRRLGMVAGADPKTGDLLWIAPGMRAPEVRPEDTLERANADDPQVTECLMDMFSAAAQGGAAWAMRAQALAAFAMEQYLWPAGIGLITAIARQQNKRKEEKRAIATLELALPFYEALVPGKRHEADVISPEIRALSVARRTGVPKFRLPAPTASSEMAAKREVEQNMWKILTLHPALRKLLTKSELPEVTKQTMQERAAASFKPLTLVGLDDADGLFFVAYTSSHAVMCFSELGDARLATRNEVLSADDEEIIDWFDLTSALDYAWKYGEAGAFVIGRGLAIHLCDIDAEVFWMVYGARWLNRLGAWDDAITLMINALNSTLYTLGDHQERLFQRYPDLKKCAALRAEDRIIQNADIGAVEDLAPHWEPRYGLKQMIAALYPEEASQFENLVEVFSFGPAPFDKGALPPPEPGEPNPYGKHAPFAVVDDPLGEEFKGADFSGLEPAEEPQKAAPEEAPAPAIIEVTRRAVSAPAAAPAAPAVVCTDHCLLQTDWEIPAGEEAFLAARASAFAWLSEKVGTTIPPRWAEGANEAEHRGFRLETEAGEGLVAIRYEHPDHALVGRRWRAEIGIGQGLPGSPGVVAIRLLALDSTRLDTPTTGTPRLIRDLMTAPGLYFAGKPASETWEVNSIADTQDLLARLQNPERDYAVLVCPLKARFTLAKPAAPLALQAQLGEPALAEYAAAFGAVAPGQLHLFAPGTTTPEALSKGSPKEVEAALMRAGALRGHLAPIPTFAEVRRRLRDLSLTRYMRQAQSAGAAAESTSAEVASMTEMLALYEAELATAQAEKRALESDIDTLTNELREAKAARYAARAGQPEDLAEEDQPQTLATPQTFAEMEHWLPALGDRIRVSPKAIREALGLTDYQNQGTVLSTIAAMYEHYWPMVFNGDAAARERWQAFLRDNRLRCGPVGTAGESSRYEDAYQAVVDGRTYSLNLHIQGPSVRDIRRCLRIYFTTDKKAKTVVIGTFPLHKPSTLT